MVWMRESNMQLTDVVGTLLARVEAMEERRGADQIKVELKKGEQTVEAPE
jgi:hypothetical protein